MHDHACYVHTHVWVRVRDALWGLWCRAKDFFRILTEPEHNMIRQQQALLATEGVELSFTDAAIRKVSQVRTHLVRPRPITCCHRLACSSGSSPFLFVLPGPIHGVASCPVQLACCCSEFGRPLTWWCTNQVAEEVNTLVDNIGARRLYTILERILEDISFSAPEQVCCPV